jgi:hypothetical protein
MNRRIKIYTKDFAPFIWSPTDQPEYNELVEKTSQKKLAKLMRDETHDLRFAMPFVPHVIRDLGLSGNYKRK